MKNPNLKPKYANSHALIIGINKFQHASPLGYAVSDAEAVRDTLTKNFMFPTEKIRFLSDEKATRSNIMSAYMSFVGECTNINDRILIFFAGHGLTCAGNRGDVGFLVPNDGNLKDLSSLIRWDELTFNAELINAKHILFIMDACYGGLALSRGISTGSMRFLKDMLLRPVRQVLTAGKADQVVADSGGPRPEHSVFTGHLLDALDGKAATEDGVITANCVMSYVYDLTIQHCRRVLIETSNEKFPVQGIQFSVEEFVSRLERYEERIRDIKQLTSCLSYWGNESHRTILQKAIGQITDHLQPESGLTVWIAMRWYPIIILAYAAGIAALSARKYDNLFDLFMTPIPSRRSINEQAELLWSIGEAIVEIEQTEIFKKLPGIDKEIDLLKKQLECLKTQKKGMMQTLLTGQIRVKV